MPPSYFAHLATATLALSFGISYVHAARKSEYINNAANASDVLVQTWYDQSSGLFDGCWWQTANMISALADLAAVDGYAFSNVNGYFETTFSNASASNGGSFLNGYYDDEGWWALAWIKVYDVTHDTKYLDAAKTIFQDMITGQGSPCGGQYWDKSHTYCAMLANELFFATAAALGNRAGTDGTDYRSLAQNGLDWIKGSGLMTSNNTFQDGRNATDNCEIHSEVFTYNQGVILGGLAEFSKLTGDSSNLDYANQIAHGTITHMVDGNGILTEPGYPGPPDDTGAQFKGVFVRNLAYLHAVSPSSDYVNFLQNNADTLWTTDRTADGMIGGDWQGPYFDASAPSQGSGVDCLASAAMVS